MQWAAQTNPTYRVCVPHHRRGIHTHTVQGLREGLTCRIVPSSDASFFLTLINVVRSQWRQRAVEQLPIGRLHGDSGGPLGPHAAIEWTLGAR